VYVDVHIDEDGVVESKNRSFLGYESDFGDTRFKYNEWDG